MTPPRVNPFRIGGVVGDEYFTDRDVELARFTASLGEPGSKLLVHGHRRMGKTSTLQRAVNQISAEGGHAMLADLSTASNLPDMANQVLSSASRAVGRRWTSWISDITKRLNVKLSLTPDATGLITPSLDVSARGTASAPDTSLANVLNGLNSLAAERKITLGVVLDEFQEITRIGGAHAEWQLRAAMQTHQHLSYILAGSKVTLLAEMVRKDRAFYQLLDPVPFGPIDPTHMAAWIDDRMHAVGLTPVAAGALCVRLAGARTRDIVRLARKCVDRASVDVRIDAAAVQAAYAEIVDDDSDALEVWWAGLRSTQQNVLRAVAATGQHLTTKSVREEFQLEDSGSTTNSLGALVKQQRLLRARDDAAYAFENPFTRGWVVSRTLADIGVLRSIDHIAIATDEYVSLPMLGTSIARPVGNADPQPRKPTRRTPVPRKKRP